MTNYNVEETNKMIISILFSQPKKKNRLNAEQLAFLEQYGIHTNLGAMKGGTKKYGVFQLYTLNSLATLDRFADFYQINLSKDSAGRRGTEEDFIFSTDRLINANNEWWEDSNRYCSSVSKKQVKVTEQLELEKPVDLLGFLLNKRFVWFSYMPSTFDSLGEETKIFKFVQSRLKQYKSSIVRYENGEYEDWVDESFAVERLEECKKGVIEYTEFIEKVLKRQASYRSFKMINVYYRIGPQTED